MRIFKHLNEGGRSGRRHAEGEGCGHRRFMRGGEGHHHRHFGRGGRVARFLEHGDLRLLVLHLIGQEPRHGYELIKAVEDLTGGAYAPSPGVIYPTLTMLEELGQAVAATEGTKKLYSITDAGRAALAESQHLVDTILARLAGGTGRENAMPVFRAMENVKTALRMKLGGRAATGETLRRIADALDELARKIEEF
jgi:DNA-binding PadR family transcriptional regulator